MEITVFSLLLILVLKKGLIRGEKISFPLFFPIIAFLALILFQMIPLPPSTIRFLSPKTYELYSQTLDGYPGETAKDGGKRQTIEGSGSIGGKLEEGGKALEGKKTKGYFENWRSISLYTHATWTGLLKIIGYLGVFLLIIDYVDTKRKLMQISTIIVFSGILVALLGIAQKIGQAPKIYWFWEPIFKKDASFFGPFVNPNHFAGYMEMVIPLSMGLFMAKWKYLLKGQRSIRESLIKVSSEEGSQLILLSFFIVLMAGTLFLSSSRGGVISFLGSMIFLLLVVIKRERGKRNLLILCFLSISIISFLLWMGIRPLVEEFSSIQDLSKDYDIQYRFQNWNDAGGIFCDFPLFGVGLETFSTIFPKYKTIDLQYYYLYLENDYIQFLCEMGIVGFGFFLWFTLGFFRELGSGHSKHEAKEIRSIQYISLYGCLTGVVAIMIHSFWDFNTHIPSNALLLSIVMGLAIAGLRISQKRYSENLQERGSRVIKS